MFLYNCLSVCKWQLTDSYGDGYTIHCTEVLDVFIGKGVGIQNHLDEIGQVCGINKI